MVIVHLVIAATPPYEVTRFDTEPGLYYEKIGTMQLREATWKLAIKIDVKALNVRYHQLQTSIEQTKKLCGDANETDRRSCDNIMQIVEDDNNRLARLLSRLLTIYRPPTDRRGLIDAIGTISKTLFGTMDAEDSRHIQEQMTLLQNGQDTIRHAAKTQIKVINATLGHIEALEQAVDRNENLLANITRRVQQKVTDLTRREDVNEHLLAIRAITANLATDVTDVLTYLTYSRHKIVPVRLLPIENIIAELKEATSHLSRGAHFPFQTRTDHWNNIQEFMQINAYYDNPNVYTILTFPIVAYPTYEIIRINVLPIHSHDNVFVIPTTVYELLAVDKDNQQYVQIKESELRNCMSSDAIFVCDPKNPVYYITPHAPCEVQVYISSEQRNCQQRHILSNVTFWITPAEPQAWLFSTAQQQKLTIKCDGQAEQKIEINRTGKIKLNSNCKLTTTDLTLRTMRREITKYIQIHLPQINLTFEINKEIETDHEPIRLEPVIRSPEDLTKLSTDLTKTREKLENSQVNIWTNEHVLYPIGSATVTAIIIGLTIAIIWSLRRKTNSSSQSDNRAQP